MSEATCKTCGYQEYNQCRRRAPIAVPLTRPDAHRPEYTGLAEAFREGIYRDGKYVVEAEYEWTGEVRFDPAELERPLHTKKPGVVFTVPRGDLFHEQVTVEQIALAFAVMAATPHLTYIVLTKRHKRMQHLAGPGPLRELVIEADPYAIPHVWPLPNVIPIVSVWDQPSADAAIPDILATPAAVRGVSLEPMLGPVKFNPDWLTSPIQLGRLRFPGEPREPFPLQPLTTSLDWVILGGETGPGARPMEPEWALDVYRQCKAAGVPFYFKQLGSAHKGPVHRSGPEWEAMVTARELPAVTS